MDVTLISTVKSNIHTLPTGWEVKKLEEIASIQGGFAFDSRNFLTEASNYQVIKMSNLYDGVLNLNRSKSFLKELSSRESMYLLQKGDILLTLTGTINKRDYGYSHLITDETNLLLNQRIARIKAFPDKVVTEYLRYELLHPRFLNQFFYVTRGGTGNQANVGTTDLNYILISLPPLNQQRKIATILSTWDEAIQTARQLLKAKQERKRGLMQQLLTGQKRLPGFSGEWENVKLGEVFQRVQRTNRPDVKEVMSISAKKGFVSQAEKFSRVIAGENLTNYTLLKRGEFAYNKGNSDLYPCGCIYKLDSHDEAAVPNVYFCFRNRGEVDAEFYKFYFQNRSLDRQLYRRINSGVRNDGLLNLNATEFFEVQISRPPFDEQRAIAALLNEVDSEIRLVTAEVQALQQQKRGLMQELLMGNKLVTVDE